MEIQDRNYEENQNPEGIEDQQIPGDPSETLSVDDDDSDLTDEEVAGLDDEIDDDEIDDEDLDEDLTIDDDVVIDDGLDDEDDLDDDELL